MKLLKTILPYLVIFILGMLFLRECNREKTIEKEVIREITVTVPEVKHQFDTVFVPVPRVIRKTDTIVLQEFLTASDSARIAMYINATSEREYRETFRDSVQEINVFSKVRGELMQQAVDYTVFEREITVRDTLKIPKHRSLYLLPKLGTTRNLDRVSAEIGLLYIDRKDRLFTISGNIDGTFLVGMGFELF